MVSSKKLLSDVCAKQLVKTNTPTFILHKTGFTFDTLCTCNL